MTADFLDNGLKVDLMYTIGSPRVGDKAFWTWFESKIQHSKYFRITHRSDPVVHVFYKNKL